MTSRRLFLGSLAAVCVLLTGCATPAPPTDPLPSWNDGAAKAVDRRLRRQGDRRRARPDYVPPAERIAVFDNDGTLWSEQPVYVQLAFAIDRVKALAPQHPEWKTQGAVQVRCWKATCKALRGGGEKGIVEIVMATHAGMTTEEFATIVDGLARHGAASRDRAGPTPRWCTSRCSSCSLTCEPTASRPSSSPAAASSSCGRGPSGLRHSARAGGRQQHQDEVRAARRHARAGAPARARFHRRQGRQARRHQPAHRPAPDPRLRQFRRRLRDAGVDDEAAKARGSA